jgi:Tetratricopeptide repeat
VQRESNKEVQVTTRRVVASAVLFVLFIFLIWDTGRTGFSSLLSAYSAGSYDIEAATMAVSLRSDSPDAHYARGTILEARNDWAGAATEYDAATRVRPDDCISWLGLARVRELNGENTEAIAAARQAVPLAPYYAQPHWQLGNILLRAGQTDEAFRELRLAARSNPAMMPGVIDLAWRLSGGDSQFVAQAVQPATPDDYQLVGQYLRHFGDLNSALFIFNASAGLAPERERRANVTALLKAKRYREAYDMWAAKRVGVTSGMINDAGFEGEQDLQEAGFGWRTVDNVQGFHLSLDTNDPRQGLTSLRADFDGESNPVAPVISQWILVEPRAHYQVRFAARTEGIVTGGLPLIAVVDGASEGVLAQSVALSQNSNGWHDYVFEFESGVVTTAVQITLQRQLCSSPSCPIFGRLWLDSVWLEKL